MDNTRARHGKYEFFFDSNQQWPRFERPGKTFPVDSIRFTYDAVQFVEDEEQKKTSKRGEPIKFIRATSPHGSDNVTSTHVTRLGNHHTPHSLDQPTPASTGTPASTKSSPDTAIWYDAEHTTKACNEKPQALSQPVEQCPLVWAELGPLQSLGEARLVHSFVASLAPWACVNPRFLVRLCQS